MISDVELLKIAKMPNMKILIQGKQAPITTPFPSSLLFPQSQALTQVYCKKKKKAKKKAR